jgi:hypothetical protein
MSRLKDEIASWRSFALPLRMPDRLMLNEMFQRLERYIPAIEAAGEVYQTEAFFLALLIEQQKVIDRLEKARHEKG